MTATHDIEAGTPKNESLVQAYTDQNGDYYEAEFKKIGDRSGFTFTVNPMAALFGSIWFGARNLWNWFLVFIIVETFAIVQIARGLLGDLAAPFNERLVQIENTLSTRIEQLEQARQSNSDNVATFENAIASLQRAIEGIKADALAAEANAIWILLGGLAVLLCGRMAACVLANTALQKRFTQWRSDRSMPSGMPFQRVALATGVALLTFLVCAYRFSFPSNASFLETFPADPADQSVVAEAIKVWMREASLSTEWFFDSLSFGIRTILDALEGLFVGTPWPVVGGFIILLTGLSAGWRTAIFTAAALTYLGYLGFWDKSMRTLALLGTAACISITLGIPLGVACARKPRLYAVVRPILDFMQTMPAFVYLIPVIAFFGTGKPAAIIATMIFGGSPVVRLTVLGMKGVPETVREAAMAFGATKRYLLWKVDLPLAAPSIMAGVNQTILLSLAMVVIASLIGAKGLGEDVLEALQYASEGQGILAGLAILFCAMILDRIVQGKRK
jgi:glycine betaine/proline transport system permease protein